MWYYATILYFGNYYHKDPRERAGLAASAIAVSLVLKNKYTFCFAYKLLLCRLSSLKYILLFHLPYLIYHVIGMIVFYSCFNTLLLVLQALVFTIAAVVTVAVIFL